MTEPRDEDDARENPDKVSEEAVEESFPGSDPPATWAGEDEPHGTSD